MGGLERRRRMEERKIIKKKEKGKHFSELKDKNAQIAKPSSV